MATKTDLSGAVTYQATYEAYGQRVTETGSTLDRQKSNTKDEDIPGYANEGFRFRDLETGGVISRDPAGFVDGPNLHTYVSENPWTKFDPEGLNETRGGNNWFTDNVLPDPVSHYRAADAGAKTMFDGNANTVDRVAGGLNYVANSILTVVSLVPGEGAVEGGIERLAGRTVGKFAGEETAETTAKNIVSKTEQKVSKEVEEKAEQKVTKEGESEVIHGNKLDDKPAEGYTLRDRDSGEVKKYGETTRGEDKFGAGKQKRYSKKYLKENNVDYVKEVSGTKKNMHRWQNENIVKHKKANGKRPDLNQSDY